MKIPTTFEAAVSRNSRSPLFTPREIEVMNYVVQGCDNKTIATMLGLAKGTVVRYIMAVRVKLHARGTSREALIAAYLATRET